MAFSSITKTGFNFASSFAPSVTEKAAKFFNPGATGNTLADKAKNLGSDISKLAFGGDVDFSADLGLDPLQFLGGVGATGWTFITAPEDISWDVSNSASRVDMFGTNNPPVVAGSRGMRDLKLGNSLVEGFVRKLSVDGKITALEELLNYGLNTSDGFVSVPVYQVWANRRSYGGPEAYYIIKSVNVKEEMRDLQGNTTRAYVDVDFMQVPKYQVNTGRDSANKAIANTGPNLVSQSSVNAAARAAASVAGQASQGVDGSKSGANAPKPTKPVDPNKFRPQQIIP